MYTAAHRAARALRAPAQPALLLALALTLGGSALAQTPAQPVSPMSPAAPVYPVSPATPEPAAPALTEAKKKATQKAKAPQKAQTAKAKAKTKAQKAKLKAKAKARDKAGKAGGQPRKAGQRTAPVAATRHAAAV